MYKEIEPKDKLKKYIQSYWLVTEVASDYESTVYPDACFDIVVTIGEPNHIVLTGIWEKAINVTVVKASNMIGVRFFPSSVDRFFNLTLAELKNTEIPFEKAMLKEVEELSLDFLFHSKSLDEILVFFDFYFSYLLEEEAYSSIFDFVHDFNLNEKIEDVAKEIGISTRHLSRQHKGKLGVTTKGYINIIRFIEAKEMLLEGKSFIDIANHCGYYDQSHFIKAFKKYTQLTPSEFLKRV